MLRLEYEADERMAAKVIGQILEETMARFDVPAISCRHRIGRLEIEDVSLAVAVGAPHRLEAFLAGLYVVDRIKHVVPVWKKEHFADGEVWVGAACDPETHALHLSEAPYRGVPRGTRGVGAARARARVGGGIGAARARARVGGSTLAPGTGRLIHADPRLVQEAAAVDDDGLAGNHGGVVAGEEGDERGEVLRASGFGERARWRGRR